MASPPVDQRGELTFGALDRQLRLGVRQSIADLGQFGLRYGAVSGEHDLARARLRVPGGARHIGGEDGGAGVGELRNGRLGLRLRSGDGRGGGQGHGGHQAGRHGEEPCVS